jgi:hypothetical protein
MAYSLADSLSATFFLEQHVRQFLLTPLSY